jgi:hypothetical protein
MVPSLVRTKDKFKKRKKNLNGQKLTDLGRELSHLPIARLHVLYYKTFQSKNVFEWSSENGPWRQRKHNKHILIFSDNQVLSRK